MKNIDKIKNVAGTILETIYNNNRLTTEEKKELIEELGSALNKLSIQEFGIDSKQHNSVLLYISAAKNSFTDPSEKEKLKKRFEVINNFQ